MSACCDTTPDAPSLNLNSIALAGNPNSGKTTLFNALTGMRQKVANYPGVTVEKKTGKTQLPDGKWVNIIDLPGTYSLVSRSPDEHVAMEVLRGLRPDTPAPDAVIVVIDASNLQRNLYLVSQLIELGRPLVVAFNMTDIAKRRGIEVHPERLEKELGVPVVAVVGHKREGIDQLKAALSRARVAPLPKFDLPQAVQNELLSVGAAIAQIDSAGQIVGSPSPPSNAAGGSSSSLIRSWICADDSARHLDRYTALAERLMIGDVSSDLKEMANRDPVKSIVASAHERLATLGIDPMQADIEAHYKWIESVSQKVAGGIGHASRSEVAALATPASSGKITLEYQPQKRHLTDRVDAILIHKFWGLVIFTLIMATLFVTIFWLASPIMDGVKNSVAWIGELTTKHLSDGPIKDLLKDGIFAGVGAVVVFVPQIAILFFFLAVLEDTGYLARAAFLMDRLLSKVGLHGKSFIPLLSSFACAIPGIMATRTIEDRKSRLATILIAPFMSCSARLPVYTLLISTFFAGRGAFMQAGIMLALYALGIIAAAGTAWVFKRSLMKGPTPAFILELPTYKIPQAWQVTRQVFNNTWSFIAKAGTTIFVLSIILWAMAYYPRLPEATVAQISEPFQIELKEATVELQKVDQVLEHNKELISRMRPSGAKSEAEEHRDILIAAIKELPAAQEKAVGAAQLDHSISGRIGHFIEPGLRPLGYDWKMGIGLISAFAAREVFVGTMGIIYSVGDPGEETADLAKAMRADTYTAGPKAGKPVWTPLVAVSLLVWFVLAMQCMSTLAIVRRETGGWKWPVFMLLYMNSLAYVVSLIVYQVGRHWFA